MFLLTDDTVQASIRDTVGIRPSTRLVGWDQHTDAESRLCVFWLPRLPSTDGYFAATMPGINNLVSMIKTRRRRDSVIMGLVIGVCIIIILSYMWK